MVIGQTQVKIANFSQILFDQNNRILTIDFGPWLLWLIGLHIYWKCHFEYFWVDARYGTRTMVDITVGSWNILALKHLRHGITETEPGPDSKEKGCTGFKRLMFGFWCFSPSVQTHGGRLQCFSFFGQLGSNGEAGQQQRARWPLIYNITSGFSCDKASTLYQIFQQSIRYIVDAVSHCGQ